MARLLLRSSAQAGNPAAGAVDLMIASVAIAEDLPLFTTNPADFAGLEHLLTVVGVTRPSVAPAHPLA